MEIGVHLPHIGPHASSPELVHLARVAEELGFHSVWFSDHLILPVDLSSRYPYDAAGRFAADSHYPWVEAFTAMSFVAGVTETIRVGSSVLIVPYRHPVVLGAQVSALQFLSGGRLILGAGAGWMKEEFDVLGVPHEQRGRRLDECLEVIQAMCSASPAEFHGEFYELPPAGTAPVPERPPEIWIGGNSKAALRRAGRFQGWQGFQLRPAEVQAAAAQLPEHVTVSVRKRLNPAAMEASVDELRRLGEVGVDHVVLEVWDDASTTEQAWRRLKTEFLPGLE